MWHVEKSPEDTDALIAALERLQMARIKVYQLPLLTPDQWENFGVPWGIFTSLKDEITSYKVDKRHGKVSVLVYGSY